MNKTIDALKLAEEAAEFARNICLGMNWSTDLPDEALAAIREALAEQSKCACDSPAWCTKYKKCNREMLGLPKAEPVKQEPVAHYKDAPHTIYLQTGCDDPEDCECSFNEWGDTTWCADQIHDTDIPYIRADYAAPVSAKREWVDLTDDEKVVLSDRLNLDRRIVVMDAVIAAFKEKNK